MNISYENPNLDKNKLCVPDTILLKRFKALDKQANISVYKDVKIYHHSKCYDISLMMLDNIRGLYIFEIKNWTFDELKNSHIKKASKQKTAINTLAFDEVHTIIVKKLNKLANINDMKIFNYLLMENLTSNEYDSLDDSFKELLPKHRLIFSDSFQTDIFKKLQEATYQNLRIYKKDEIIGNLLVQYSILNDNYKRYLCTKNQIEFINKKLKGTEYLIGRKSSGKSNLLLLKSIFELLNDKSKHIIIIKQTITACDIAKAKLLNILKYGIIKVDLSSISLLTPSEFKKIYPNKIFKKTLKATDIIMCDDSDKLDQNFINHLHIIQKKSALVLVTTDNKNDNVDLKQKF